MKEIIIKVFSEDYNYLCDAIEDLVTGIGGEIKSVMKDQGDGYENRIYQLGKHDPDPTIIVNKSAQM